jgi:SAM-dependent methyltransferase
MCIKDNEFQKKLIESVRKTYSSENENLINLSSLETFRSMGYPEDFLVNSKETIECSFPVVYPFEGIEVKGKNVIDLGCGAGLDSILALYLGAEKVFALDLSFSFLKKINDESVFKINGYMDSLPFNYPYFDIVLMNGSLNLIYDKMSLLEQINGIIKKKALLIVGDLFWCGSEKEREIYRDNIDAWCWCTGGCLTEDEILFITFKNGFNLVERKELEKIETFTRMRYIFKNE